MSKSVRKPAVVKPEYEPFGAEPAPAQVRTPPPGATSVDQWLTPQDLFLFNEGSHLRLYEKLGSHPGMQDSLVGFHFGVWAPNADYVSVVGDFNEWDRGRNRLYPVGSSGVWA